MSHFVRSIVIAALLAGTKAGSAAVLLLDCFDVAGSTLAVTSRAGWTITGNVDLVA